MLWFVYLKCDCLISIEINWLAHYLTIYVFSDVFVGQTQQQTWGMKSALVALFCPLQLPSMLSDKKITLAARLGASRVQSFQ